MTVCTCGHSLSAHNHRKVRRWPRVCTKRGCRCDRIVPVEAAESNLTRFMRRFSNPTPEGL